MFEVWVPAGRAGAGILDCTGSDLAYSQSVEASVLLPKELAPALGVKNTGLHFLTAGDQGVGDWPHVDQGLGEPVGLILQQPCSPTGILRVWEAASGQCVYTQPQMPGLRQELTHCTLARAAGLLLTVTADHNLLLYEAHSLQLQKQVST